MGKLIKILPLALGAGFLFFGAQKFGATNPVFEIIADRSEINLFEPTIRYLTGIGEILAGILLLLPRDITRKAGSLLGLAILVGAIGFHISPWLGINVPGIGHGLFITALAMTLINLFLARHYFGRKLNP